MHKKLSQSRKSIAKRWHWFSTQYWIWWTYFKNVVLRLLSSIWELLVDYSLVILLFAGGITVLLYLFTKALPTEELLKLNTMMSMIFGWAALCVGGIILCLLLIALFILSLFPKGREIANGYFAFLKPTRLEKFKSAIEDRLASMDKRLTNMDKRLNDIETILKTLAEGTTYEETSVATEAKTKKESKKKNGKT
jgi:hypothetical protein